jgi:hypothetical protein
MEALTQAKSIIQRYQEIFILPSLDLQGDSVSAAIALFFTLKKAGKNVNLPITLIPERLRFLFNEKGYDNFIISVDTKNSPISKMRYEKNENELKIYLTAQKGEISPEKIKFLNQTDDPLIIDNSDWRQSSADLIITLGANSLESLGEYFQDSNLSISQSAVLNIDNQALNENFGDVNLVDVTSSLSETVLTLIELINKDIKEEINSDIATALLAGIVWSSQNFRNPRTRPKTFQTAARLIEMGADHQKIVYHLYKQKKVSQIKILGKILEKLTFDEKRDIYSACLTEGDFKETQAGSKDLSFAIEELKSSFGYLPNLLVLWESHSSPIVIKGVLCSPNHKLAELLLENFEGVSKGESSLFLIRENNLAIAKEKIFNLI